MSDPLAAAAVYRIRDKCNALGLDDVGFAWHLQKEWSRLAAQPSPSPVVVEPTAVKQVLEWYRDEVLALSINTANQKTNAVRAGLHVLLLDAGNRAVTALCHPALNPKRPEEGKS